MPPVPLAKVLALTLCSGLLLSTAVVAQSTDKRDAFDWNAMATVGFRFLDLHGSRDRYRSDHNLDEGFRLIEASFGGRLHAPGRWLDSIDLQANDIGDPYERVHGRFERDQAFRLDAELRRSRMKYQASGDFHRVDRRHSSASFTLKIPLDDELEVFAGFARSKLEGYWLTNRIGDQNLTPIGAISGVTSPRRLDEDEFELGFTLASGRTSLTVASSFLDQRENQAFAYSQAATANPAFTESEDSRASNSLEGPGVRLALSHHQGAVSIDLQGQAYDRRRRSLADGSVAGYDIAQFTTQSHSLAEGSARTYLLTGGLSWDIDDDLTLHTELHAHDHHEHLLLDQRDVTVHPSLSSTVTVLTQRDQRSSSRLREASAELEWQALRGLWLSGGWGWSQEQLRLPDLSFGDADISAGTLVERGYLGRVEWRPGSHWQLRGNYRDFGQNGIKLTELTDRDTRGYGGMIKYSDGGAWLSLDTRHRRSKNPIADSRTKSASYTLGGGYSVSESFRGHLSYSLAEMNNRTRSSFYFSPSTTPVATLVGFRGETHSASAGFDWDPSERLRCAVSAAYTTVHGDYEVDLYHWSADLSISLDSASRTGLRIEQVDYHEASNPDDYSAWSLLIYFSTEVSGRDR